ncbi:MAG: hypothetical protein HYT79_07370 [Elusimicrobia bacterium]|nr:hypothetical protein [Elusimicrobiota bacterium]
MNDKKELLILASIVFMFGINSGAYADGTAADPTAGCCDPVGEDHYCAWQLPYNGFLGILNEGYTRPRDDSDGERTGGRTEWRAVGNLCTIAENLDRYEGSNNRTIGEEFGVAQTCSELQQVLQSGKDELARNDCNKVFVAPKKYQNFNDMLVRAAQEAGRAQRRMNRTTPADAGESFRGAAVNLKAKFSALSRSLDENFLNVLIPSPTAPEVPPLCEDHQDPETDNCIRF